MFPGSRSIEPLVTLTGMLGVTKQLSPNSVLGVRTFATKKSDAAWYRAQAAGAWPLMAGGVIGTVLAIGGQREAKGILFVGLSGAAILVGVGLAAVLANRAADKQPPNPRVVTVTP